jgi:hypothetical protein
MALALAVLAASPAAGDTARSGLALAAAAADAWADDARAVWIENDAPLDTLGQADAWGYLYYSADKHAMRSWSVRAGEIVAAEDHAVVAAAPAVDPEWKDSDAIATAARAALEQPQAGMAQLESLVLVRGVFAAETAWVAVFSAGTGPRLFLLLDARDGNLLKRWRG